MEEKVDLEFLLKKRMHSTILVPPSIGSKNGVMNWGLWTRDEYYRALAMWGEVMRGIVKCHQIIFDKINFKGKFDYSCTDWLQDWVYIQALYNGNLEETDLKWPHHQNDVAGNFLEMLCWAKDVYRANFILDYLEVIEYWHNSDCGFWERGPKETRASSIAACLRGLHAYENVFESTAQTRKLIDWGYQVLESILPNETPGRESDLALLSVIYPGKLDSEIITPPVKEQIIANVMPLVGDYGIARFKGDPWDGIADTLGWGSELEWSFLSWLYICTGDEKYLMRNRELKNEFGVLPEGFKKNGEPNCTPCLVWNKSIDIVAERMYWKRVA